MSGVFPVIKSKEAIDALLKTGFFIDRQSGGHVIIKHSANPKIRITVPRHNKDLKRKTLKNIIEQSGFTVEKFKDLL